VNRDEARAAIGRVLGQIAPEVELGEIPPDAELLEAIDLDSMDFLNFVTGLLEETGVDIPERDYPAVLTLEGCITYLVEQTA
jgi:acyl carrier protein